jgi:deoxyadenosine/deoxycytidine kinase
MKSFLLPFLFFILSTFVYGESQKGYLIALTGISGCGKSTLAKELAGICNADLFLEPEEDQWPDFVRDKQPYSEFSTYTCIRGFRAHALWNAWDRKEQGQLVFTDSFYDKITSYYLGNPGMEWLIPHDDPYYACIELLSQIDTATLPNPNCIILIDISFEDWLKALAIRNRTRDSLDGFKKNYELYRSYIKEAVETLCRDKKIKLIFFTNKLEDPKQEASSLLSLLKSENLF